MPAIGFISSNPRSAAWHDEVQWCRGVCEKTKNPARVVVVWGYRDIYEYYMAER
jgi:hypothetical protein